jgi:hypothetical protein
MKKLVSVWAVGVCAVGLAGCTEPVGEAGESEPSATITEALSRSCSNAPGDAEVARGTMVFTPETYNNRRCYKGFVVDVVGSLNRVGAYVNGARKEGCESQWIGGYLFSYIDGAWTAVSMKSTIGALRTRSAVNPGGPPRNLGGFGSGGGVGVRSETSCDAAIVFTAEDGVDPSVPQRIAVSARTRQTTGAPTIEFVYWGD